ncbi:GNAT family N-acetyltransferase [Phenylobacterium sp.]|uniref:GNAT family N-acetyltransferase n=1 Tax=Phenylobacterium sp. TaxID=1871053 RepID=UPI0035B3F037
MVELRTERLRLRRARPEDLEALFAVLSHPEAMRYWSSPPHADREQTRAWLDEMIAATDEDFVVEFEGRVIGKAGAYRLPDVGYILHPDAWGRGLATEAMAAVVAHVFATRDVDRLTADVDPRNGASIRLLEKLGFRETGRAARTWRVGEEWCDSVYLALERPTPRP